MGGPHIHRRPPGCRQNTAAQGLLSGRRGSTRGAQPGPAAGRPRGALTGPTGWLSPRSRSRRGLKLTGPCPAPQEEASGPVRSLPGAVRVPSTRSCRPAPPHEHRNLPACRGAPDSPARARQWRRFRCSAEVRALGANNYKSQQAARRGWVGKKPCSRAPLAVSRVARRLLTTTAVAS